MVRIPACHKGTFWYFTVSETARSAAGEAGEYILDPFILGYRSISGGVSNRAVLNQTGSFHLDGFRMAKLDTPIRLFAGVSDYAMHIKREFDREKKVREFIRIIR